MKKLNTKTVSLYGFFTAAALLFGYIEYMVPLEFIAPGVKLGFANGVFLILLFGRRVKAAFFVNLARILLSAFLFATPFSLLFSMTAGITSMLAMTFISNCKRFGFIGVSVLGAVVHNFTQLCVASATVGRGVWYYLPFLFIAGLVAGVVIGILTYLIFGRIQKSKIFMNL